MAIRTFNSVGGFSVGEVPVQVIDNTGNIANVTKAVIGNVTVTTSLVAGNIKANNLTNTQVTFTNNGVLSDSANLTFSGNLLTITDWANIVSTDGSNYVSLKGSDGTITTTGNVSFANGGFTADINGDVAVANSLVVGSTGANTDSAFYVDAAGNFSIKIANTANGGFETVFSVDATTGNITTKGSVVSPTGGAATIQAPGLNTQILFNDNSNVGASSLFTFDKTAQALTIDGNIQLLDDTGSGRLVLPQGGYIYGDSSYSAVVHSEGAGYAQLEYIDPSNESYVWVESSGAYMEQGSAQIRAINSEGVELEYNGSRVNVTSSGSRISSGVGTGGTAYVESNTDGNVYISTTGGDYDWNFDVNGALTTPGSIYAPNGDIYANSGLVNANTLNIANVANLHGDVGIDGDLTVLSNSYLEGSVTIGIVGDAPSDLELSGNMHVYQDASIDGELTIGNLHVTGNVTSSLIPGSDVTYDLGADGARWRDLWLSGFTINLGNTTISSGGANTMIVSNAVVGFPGTYGNVTVTLGELKAGNLLTAGSANIGNAATKANLFVSGNAAVDQTTAATSTITGAFTVKGGVGIGGAIYVGNIANIDGNLLIGNATANASANITGDLKVGGNANVVNNMVIGGNLTVSGTTTYVNTTNSSIKDALIDIAGANNGADLSGIDTYDRGLYIHNYSTGVNNQFMGWKQADSEFQLKTGVTSTGNAITGGSYANVRVDHLFGTIGTTTQNEITDMTGLVNITVSGNANVTGTANINTAILADLTLGELHFTNLDVAGPADNEVVVLRTDGAGEVSFEVIHTDRIGNASSGIFVNENGNVEVTANENLVFTVTESGANVVGTLDVTGELTAGSLSVGSLTPDSISLGDTKILPSTTTSPDTTQLTIAQAPVDAGGAVEFFVKGTSVFGGVTRVTVATITALYDGTNVDYATYGKLHMGGGAGTLDVNYASGNIQLLATPSQNTDTVWTAQIRTI